MKQVVVHNTKRVFDGFLKIDEAEVSYQRFDGSMSPPMRRLSLERGDSVAAVIYHRATRRALFVNQFRYPAYSKGPGWILETVAGMLGPGENPRDALIREIQEEAGYRVDKVEPIATFYVSPGGSSERVLLFYTEVSATDKTHAGGGLQEEGEDIETVFLSPEQLTQMLATGAVHDAKTLIGIQWLLHKLSQEEGS